MWLGLVKKIADADRFVVLDSVQFEKNYFQNRNKIRTKEGWMWLTVPVKKQPLATLIKDIEISYNQPWQEKYLKSLQAHYGGAPYFKDYFPKIEKIIRKNHTYLAGLNIELLEFVLDSFGIKKQLIRSSELSTEKAVGGSDVCLAICKQQCASIYLAGPSGKDYLKLDDFDREGIEVLFHEFHHPEYKQLHGEFLPYMSSIDLLFNHGQEAKNILIS